MSVYKVVQLVGTSPDSWGDAARTAVNRASQSLRDLREDAAHNAVRRAGNTLRDLRIATVTQMDYSVSKMQVGTGQLVDVGMFRVKLDLSFKYGD